MLFASLGLAAAVFAQIAVAAHACTVFAPMTAPDASVQVHAGHDPTPCGDMNAEQDNVCFRHCQNDDLTLYPQPAIIAVPVRTYYVVDDIVDVDRAGVLCRSIPSRPHALLARVNAPSLTVRNCRFRT